MLKKIIDILCNEATPSNLWFLVEEEIENFNFSLLDGV